MLSSVNCQPAITSADSGVPPAPSASASTTPESTQSNQNLLLVLLRQVSLAWQCKNTSVAVALIATVAGRVCTQVITYSGRRKQCQAQLEQTEYVSIHTECSTCQRYAGCTNVELRVVVAVTQLAEGLGTRQVSARRDAPIAISAAFACAVQCTPVKLLSYCISRSCCGSDSGSCDNSPP